MNQNSFEMQDTKAAAARLKDAVTAFCALRGIRHGMVLASPRTVCRKVVWEVKIELELFGIRGGDVAGIGADPEEAFIDFVCNLKTKCPITLKKP